MSKATIAGLGRIGWRHASDILKTEGLGLLALCEPNAGLAEKAKTRPRKNHLTHSPNLMIK